MFWSVYKSKSLTVHIKSTKQYYHGDVIKKKKKKNFVRFVDLPRYF